MRSKSLPPSKKSRSLAAPYSRKNTRQKYLNTGTAYRAIAMRNRCGVLKALAWSTAKTWRPWAKSARTLWTTRSTPFLCRHPNWSLPKCALISEAYRANNTFPAILRTTSPIAIGRMPPLAFPIGTRRARTSLFRTLSSIVPFITSRINAANSLRQTSSLMITTIISAVHPVHPPAAPVARLSTTSPSSFSGRDPVSVDPFSNGRAGSAHGPPSSECGWRSRNLAATTDGVAAIGRTIVSRIRAALPRCPARDILRAFLIALSCSSTLAPPPGALPSSFAPLYAPLTLIRFFGSERKRHPCLTRSSRDALW